MAIDKSIRQWYESGLLVKKGPPGTRPGFQYGPHSAPSGPSGPPGGGDRQMTYTAPAPAPAPDRQDRARQQAEVERVAEVKRQEAQAIAEYAEREASRIAEAKRVSDFAEARKKMTQLTDVANPLARTPIPLGTVDPYQQSYAFPDKLWTDPRSVSKSGGRIDKPLTGRSRDI